MAIVRSLTGPLSYAALYKINETEFFDKTRPPIISAQDDDEDYFIKIGDRPDLLAFVKLGDTERGWIINLRNDMRLWPNDWYPGRKIKIPTLRSLQQRKIV